MIVWVVVLHWLTVCDYFFKTVFVLCNRTKKMLIVISGFTCIYKWIFLIIIFNLYSFLKTSKVTEAVVWRFSNFIKNEALARMFSCEFC